MNFIIPKKDMSWNGIKFDLTIVEKGMPRLSTCQSRITRDNCSITGASRHLSQRAKIAWPAQKAHSRRHGEQSSWITGVLAVCQKKNNRLGWRLNSVIYLFIFLFCKISKSKSQQTNRTTWTSPYTIQFRVTVIGWWVTGKLSKW